MQYKKNSHCKFTLSVLDTTDNFLNLLVLFFKSIKWVYQKVVFDLKFK